MKFEQGIQKVYNLERKIINILYFISTTALASTMFLTFFDVFMRYVIRKPFLGAYELTEFLMAITISMALGYTALEKGHIKVDFIIIRLPLKIQKIIEILTNMIFAGIAFILAWSAFSNVFIVLDSNILSTVLQIPEYPFVAIVFVGHAILFAVVITDLVNSFKIKVKKNEPY